MWEWEGKGYSKQLFSTKQKKLVEMQVVLGMATVCAMVVSTAAPTGWKLGLTSLCIFSPKSCGKGVGGGEGPLPGS